MTHISSYLGTDDAETFDGRCHIEGCDCPWHAPDPEPQGEPADISEDETPEKPETSVVIDTATHALHKMLEWQSAHDALTEAITSGAEPSTREVIALHTLVADREAIKAIREYRNTIG